MSQELETDQDVTTGDTDTYRMSLTVDIDKTGPCQRHVRVVVPRKDLDHFRSEAVQELSGSASVPGFRSGRVPAGLIEKRFRKELDQQLRQQVLMQSLQQLSEDNQFDPINEPDFDLEGLVIPEDGDFQYEFDVEVRPEFDLPEYKGLKIERPVREVTDEQVNAYRERYLRQYGSFESTSEPAAAGDYITASFAFIQDKPLRKMSDLTVQLKPVLQFPDGQLTGFDELVAGARPGDTRNATITISAEAESVEMRGETVQVEIQVTDVKKLVLPELTSEFLGSIGVEDADELNVQIRSMLERQVQYEQRQATRRQILDKITESADWELPEKLVRKQVENALRREILEMQQAGFTTQQIRARENQLRQQSVTSTRQALKEHFVLDRIATKEEVEVTPPEIDAEIYMMAIQRGENPRRVRSRLQKSGMFENLEAQIRERKAVDFLLKHAEFSDVPAPVTDDSSIESVMLSICGPQSTIESHDDEHDHDHDHDHDGDHDHDHDHG